MHIHCAIPVLFGLGRPRTRRVGGDGLSRIIMMTCTASRGASASASSAVLRGTRRVPGCPNKARNLVHCLTGGVGCPISTRGDGARKHIIMRVVVSGRNHIADPGVIRDISPSLSTRTVHMVANVPH